MPGAQVDLGHQSVDWVMDFAGSHKPPPIEKVGKLKMGTKGMLPVQVCWLWAVVLFPKKTLSRLSNFQTPVIPII
jgi:hypothetical protein